MRGVQDHGSIISDESSFFVSVELCTVLESEDTGSDVFPVHFSIVRSFKDESHDMMPSSLVVLLVLIHTEVGPGIVPGSALVCTWRGGTTLKMCRDL